MKTHGGFESIEIIPPVKIPDEIFKDKGIGAVPEGFSNVREFQVLYSAVGPNVYEIQYTATMTFASPTIIKGILVTATRQLPGVGIFFSDCKFLIVGPSNYEPAANVAYSANTQFLNGFYAASFPVGSSKLETNILLLPGVSYVFRGFLEAGAVAFEAASQNNSWMTIQFITL